MDTRIKDNIKTSGNNLHLDVANKLRELDWEVTISPYYLDDTSEKAREIDIVATKPMVYSKGMNTNLQQEEFYAKLFIECKYIDSDVIFWKDQISDVNIKHATQYAINISQIGGKLDQINEKFHYSKFQKDKCISKLFTNIPKPQKSTEDVIYQSFNQSLKSLIHFRSVNLSSKTIYYPVVIYKLREGSLLLTYDKSIDETKEVKNQSLEVFYTFKANDGNAVSKFFIVDFVDFSKLENYINTINVDMIEVRSVLSSL